MPRQLFANNATSTLSGVLPQGGTTLVCTAGGGALFPSPGAGEFFLLTIYTKDTYAMEQDVEVVKVTSRAGDVFTIERDVELLTGNVGGNAYNGSATPVYLELRWTALGAAGMLQAGDIGETVQPYDATLSWVATNAASAGLDFLAEETAAGQRNALGLGNVSNTTDADKPISTATAAALASKLDSASYMASDVLAKIKTVDGVGSDLDADKLDGIEGANFARTDVRSILSGGVAGETGGGVQLAKPATTSLSGDVEIEIANDGLRVHEVGGSARGAVLNLLKSSPGVGSRIETTSAQTVATTSKNLVVFERCFVNVADLTLTLPASPDVGDWVQVIVGDFTTTVVARNGENIMGIAEDMTINRAHMALTFLFVSETHGWAIS